MLARFITAVVLFLVLAPHAAAAEQYLVVEDTSANCSAPGHQFNGRCATSLLARLEASGAKSVATIAFQADVKPNTIVKDINAGTIRTFIRRADGRWDYSVALGGITSCSGWAIKNSGRGLVATPHCPGPSKGAKPAKDRTPTPSVQQPPRPGVPAQQRPLTDPSGATSPAFEAFARGAFRIPDGGAEACRIFMSGRAVRDAIALRDAGRTARYLEVLQQSRCNSDMTYKNLSVVAFRQGFSEAGRLYQTISEQITNRQVQGTRCIDFSTDCPLPAPVASARPSVERPAGPAPAAHPVSPCQEMAQQMEGITSKALEGCQSWTTIQGSLRAVGGGNVRENPSTEAAVLGRFQPGHTFRAYGLIRNAEREWYMVSGHGWTTSASTSAVFVAASLFEKAPAASPSPSPSPQAGATPPPSPAEKKQFIARCIEQTRAKSPGSRENFTESCTQSWNMTARSRPLVDAMLPFVREGTPQFRTLDAVKAFAGGIAWRQERDANGQITLQARVEKFSVSAAKSPRLHVEFSWSAIGEPVPYDVETALKLRGATMEGVACQNFGASEFTQVYRVSLAGHRPFALTAYTRHAPTANAQSSYSVSLLLDGAVPTLASLKREDPDFGWEKTCNWDN